MLRKLVCTIFSQSVLTFFKGRYYIRCGALTYTSLLGFIPLVSVLVAILSKLPVVRVQLPKIQNFIFHNFLPGSGEELINYVQMFSHQAQKLPWSQFIFLIAISIVLVLSVERALNLVFNDNNQTRSVLSGLLRSWLMIAITTFFMIVSLLLSGYVLSMPFLSHLKIVRVLDEYSSWWLPFLSSFIGFSLLYFVIPRKKIAVKYALVGSFVASILFEVMKFVFTWYVISLPAYNAIYGTLAIIPVFMIWIYCFWCIVIYGALLTQALRNFII